MNLPKNFQNNNQSGQALIIILLAMSITLTLVLSSVSRSITDVEITDSEEESLRAFSAAEAGVEQALLTFTQQGSIPPGGESRILEDQIQTETKYEATIVQSSVGAAYEYPREILPGETATFWFTGRNEDGDLTCDNNSCVRTPQIYVCFGDSDVTYSPLPAVEVQFYYDDTSSNSNNPPDSIAANDYSTIKTTTFGFDTASIRPTPNNFATAGGCSIAGITGYQFGTDINLNTDTTCNPSRACMIAVKVKSLYTTDPLPIAVAAEPGSSQPNLPAQGIVINSVGTSGQSTRQLNVQYSFTSIPSIFNNTVFSGGSLEK